jgi:hypothetical protein
MKPHASDDSTARITHPYQGHYMEPAFLGFVSFASKNLMAQFEAECGKVKLGTSPIDRLIDKATGLDAHEAQRFVDWCVVEIGHPDELETAPDGDRR